LRLTSKQYFFSATDDKAAKPSINAWCGYAFQNVRLLMAGALPPDFSMEIPDCDTITSKDEAKALGIYHGFDAAILVCLNAVRHTPTYLSAKTALALSCLGDDN